MRRRSGRLDWWVVEGRERERGGLRPKGVRVCFRLMACSQFPQPPAEPYRRAIGQPYRANTGGRSKSFACSGIAARPVTVSSVARHRFIPGRRVGRHRFIGGGVTDSSGKVWAIRRLLHSRPSHFHRSVPRERPPGTPGTTDRTPPGPIALPCCSSRMRPGFSMSLPTRLRVQKPLRWAGRSADGSRLRTGTSGRGEA